MSGLAMRWHVRANTHGTKVRFGNDVACSRHHAWHQSSVWQSAGMRATEPAAQRRRSARFVAVPTRKARGRPKLFVL